MTNRTVFAWLCLAATAASLLACASAPAPSWIDTIRTAPPPIVLRMAEAPVRTEVPASAGGEFGGYVWSGTMIGLAYSIPTLGASLVLVPLGMVEGAKQAGIARECAERWRAAVGDPAKWLAETLAPVAPLATMEDELARLAIKPPPVVVLEREAATAEARVKALERIGERLGARSLLVGEVSIVLERVEAPRCGVKFTGIVRLRAHEGGVLQKDGPHYVARASHVDDKAQIETWAKEPDLVREELRRMLRKLAAEVVSTYPWR